MADNDKITIFAETNFRNQKRQFGIKQDDRRRHFYIIGKTGMGKTNLMENMVISDIRAGNGVCVVDPHGDFAEKMLDYIPSKRVNDTIYFNSGDLDYPIAFNVVETIDDPKYKNLVASGLIGVFKKIWADSWGPRLEYVLRNAILALLDYPGSTLLGIMRILVDKVYRKKVIDNVTDPVVRSFWIDEFSKYPDRFQAEAIAPIQNKVGQFLSSSLIRNIVGQTKSTIDLRDVLDNKKILLLNLSKGSIGEDNSALLGAMMITKIQLAAMSRVDILEEERKDFYLYVDEFQNFATESFADILSEARKYHLNLIIAHQYIGQLDEKVVDAVFGNVGTIITFRVGAADAELLAKEFEPVFDENDLVNLGKYNIYLKLMIDGVASHAFSATTLPPVWRPEGCRENIIKVSRERYAKPRKLVEEKIARWSGMIPKQAFQTTEYREKRVLYSGVEERSAEAKHKTILETKSDFAETVREEKKRPKKKLFKVEVKCDNCGAEIKELPFEPKPGKPVYCKKCLDKIRKGKKIKQEFVGEKEPRPISLNEAVEKKPIEFYKTGKKNKENKSKTKEIKPGEIVKLD